MRALNRIGIVLAAMTIVGCCCPSPCTVATVEAPRADEPAPQRPEVVPKPKTWVPELREHGVRRTLYEKRLKGLHWEGMSLSQVVTYLQTITGVPFRISERTMEEKHDDVVVDLKVDDVAAGSILTLIAEQNELRWEVRDGTVWILTTAETEGDLRLRYFDVKDLIRPTQEHGFASIDDAVASLQERVSPEYWERPDVTMEGRNGVLIVRASRGVLHAVGRELTRERHKLEPPALSEVHRDRLARIRVSVSISKQPISEVLDWLQLQAGVNLVIDARIAADVAAVEISALEAKDLPLLTVLRMVAAQAGEHAVWVSRGDVAVLTVAEMAH